MNRPLSFFKKYKCYDSVGHYCGNLETHLRAIRNDNNVVVKKLGSEKSRHGFLWVADTDAALKWILSQDFDIECHIDNDKSPNDKSPVEQIYRQQRIEKDNIIKNLKAEIKQLHSKTLELEFSLRPPLQILESRKEILDRSKAFHPKCGIYFLIYCNEIVYIGQSVNIETRVPAHISDKQFTHYSYDKCEKEDLTKMEALYIKYFSPKYNKFSPMAKAELFDVIYNLQDNHERSQ